MSIRIARAITDHFDPVQGSTTSLVIVSGHVDDVFYHARPPAVLTLKDSLHRCYLGRAETFITYNQIDGLRISGEPATSSERQNAEGPPQPFDPRAVAVAAARAAAARIETSGRFQLDPHSALMEIHGVLKARERTVTVIEGIDVWEPVSERRVDVVAAMQAWIQLARLKRSLIVFAGRQPSQRLTQFFSGRPGVREVVVPGPAEEEIADWLVAQEFTAGRRAYAPIAFSRVVSYLSGVGGLPGNGLLTLIPELTRLAVPLDDAWLKARGAVHVDPADVDVAGFSAYLESNFVGQEKAKQSVLSMAEGVRVRGLQAGRRRPIWRGLFAGPAGVGKTELAKITSRFFYGVDDCCLVACTEFKEQHEVAKLLGAPPGYVGYGTPGQLQAFLARQRAGVIVFDEFEKAHPAVREAVMGILEEGTLTTGDGQLLRFDTCIIIATTNAGSRDAGEVLLRHPDATAEQVSAIYEDALFREFRDYVLRRFDDRIVFQPLSQAERAEVARIHIRRYLQSLRTENDYQAEVRWGEPLVARVLERADPRLGGGEVRNAVERVVGDLLLERYFRLRPLPGLVDLDDR